MIVKMFDFSSTLSTAVQQGSATNQRVDRIVAALPDLKVKIAQEDLEKKIALVVVTKNPTEVSPGRWTQSIIVLDYSGGRLSEFQIPSRGSDDMGGGYTVSGLTNRISVEKISFDEFTVAATEIGKPKAYPVWIDASASYGIVRHRVDYARRINAQFGRPVRELGLARKPLNWEELVDDMIKQEAELDKIRIDK